MKIEVLGSGNINSTHPSASAIIDGKVMMDVPSGITKQIENAKYDVRDIEVCLISHFHADHFFDLPTLLLEKYEAIKEKNEVDKDRNQSLELNMVVIGPKDIEKTIRELMHLGFNNYGDKILEESKVKFIECEDGASIMLSKDLIISTIKVEHTDELESYGFIVEDGKSRVGFTGDTKYCEGVEEIGNNSDIIFMDSTMENSKMCEVHMGINDITKFADEHQDLRIITTHMLDSTREKMIKEIDVRKAIKENSKMQVNEKVEVAYEGMIINL